MIHSNVIIIKRLFFNFDVIYKYLTQMRLILIVSFLAFLCICACKSDPTKTPIQKTSSSKTKSSLTAEETEKKGFTLLTTDPPAAIPYFADAGNKYLESGENAKAAIAFANAAGVYSKNLNDSRNALVYANKALNQWRSLNDKIQIANQLKDIGLYNGEEGNFELGKKQLNEAMGYFTERKAQNGVAECKMNLAKIARLEGNLVLAESLYLESNDIWRKTGMKTKLFTNNLFAMRLYRQMGDEKKLKAAYDITMALKDQIKMFPKYEQELAKTLLEVKVMQ